MKNIDTKIARSDSSEKNIKHYYGAINWIEYAIV